MLQCEGATKAVVQRLREPVCALVAHLKVHIILNSIVVIHIVYTIYYYLHVIVSYNYVYRIHVVDKLYVHMVYVRIHTNIMPTLSVLL